MARLPKSGSDAGKWGDILNDFLLQSHRVDGTIKNGTISTANLQDSSVSASKLSTSNAASDGKFLEYRSNELSWSSLPAQDPTMGGDLSGTSSNAQLINGSVTEDKLAANTVSSSHLKNNSVTTAKLSDGSVTASKLAPGLHKNTNNGVRSLLIMYSPPTVINARYNLDYSAGVLCRYDDVVLGAGLQDPSNTYHADTATIISKITEWSPDTIVWGYIDAGVSTGNHSLSQLQTQIDQWVAMGAKGILCDLIGYAYGVSRSRQNDIINYIHSKNIGAMLNVYNPDEVLSSDVNPSYNPSGAATAANSNDVLLLESWVCNSDAYPSPFYVSFSDVKARGDKAKTYRASMGIRLYATNILSHHNHSANELKDYYDLSEALARVWRLDGTGISASNYAATGPDIGKVIPHFSSFKPIQMRPTAPYILNGDWTQVQAPDLGITINYNDATNTRNWSQY